MAKEGTSLDIKYPRVLGHEVAGTIDKLGADDSFWPVRQRLELNGTEGRAVSVKLAAWTTQVRVQPS